MAAHIWEVRCLDLINKTYFDQWKAQIAIIWDHKCHLQQMEPRWAAVTPTHRSQFRGWSKGGWTRWRTTWRGRRGRGRGRRRRPRVATTDAGRRASRAAKASTTHSATSRRGSLETRLVVIKKSCTVVEWTPHDQEVVCSYPTRLQSFLSLSFCILDKVPIWCSGLLIFLKKGSPSVLSGAIQAE